MGVTKVYRREKKSSTKALNGRLNGRASYLKVDASACQTGASWGCDIGKPGGRNISAGGVSRRILIQLFPSPEGDT